MRISTRKMVLSAMMAAIICVATIVIKIPIAATGGYINLGDAFVILSGMLLGPLYGFLGAGIGSALADIISGYVIYAPITFIVKGVMAVIVGIMLRKISTNKIGMVIWAGIIAEIVMIAGYFAFEATFMGYGIGALSAIPGNAMQGIAGIVISVLLTPMTEKLKNQGYLK